MKKWFAGILALLLLALAGIYLLIPSPLHIVRIASLRCTTGGAFRVLSDTGHWKKWWPCQQPDCHCPSMDSGGYVQGGLLYHLSGKSNSTLQVGIREGNTELETLVSFISLGPDSVALDWSGSLPAGKGPLARLSSYRRALRLADNISSLIGYLRPYLENPEHIYGMPISLSSISDTLLYATRKQTDTFPSTTDIYGMVSAIKAYTSSQGAKITGQPMLNITKIMNAKYQVMVALPVDHTIRGNGEIFERKMIPGNFMVAYVKGGPYSVNQAMEQMQLYFDDYRKVSMAIPFQSLVTDRLEQPDTSRWVTKIYAPVFK